MSTPQVINAGECAQIDMRLHVFPYDAFLDRDAVRLSIVVEGAVVQVVMQGFWWNVSRRNVGSATSLGGLAKHVTKNH